MPNNSEEAQQLREEIIRELPEGEAWLTIPHYLLGEDTPEQRIEVGDLESVRNLLYQIIHVGVA